MDTTNNVVLQRTRKEGIILPEEGIRSNCKKFNIIHDEYLPTKYCNIRDFKRVDIKNSGILGFNDFMKSLHYLKTLGCVNSLAALCRNLIHKYLILFYDCNFAR